MKLPHAERRTWIVGTILAILFVLFVGFVILSTSQTALWVGSGNLTIEFVVVDAELERPIPNVKIEILELDRPPNPSGNHLFNLLANDEGIARTTQRVMTSGADHSLPFLTDTFHASVPYWRIIVTAAGYGDFEIPYIGAFSHLEEHMGPSQYRLILPIQMIKQ